MAWFKRKDSTSDKFNTPKRRPIRTDNGSLQNEDADTDLAPKKDEGSLLNETVLAQSEPASPAITGETELGASPEAQDQTTITKKSADDDTFMGVSVPSDIAASLAADETQTTAEKITLADQKDAPVTAFSEPDTQDVPFLSAVASSRTEDEDTDQTISMFSPLEGSNVAGGETVVPFETGSNSSFREAEPLAEDTAKHALELNPPVRFGSVAMFIGLAALLLGLVWIFNSKNQVDSGGTELDTVQTTDVEKPELLELSEEEFSSVEYEEPQLVIDDEFVGEIPDLTPSDDDEFVLHVEDSGIDDSNEQAIYDSFDATLDESESSISAVDGAASVGIDSGDGFESESGYPDAGELGAFQEDPRLGQASANTLQQSNGEIPRTVIVRDGDMLSTIAQRVYDSSFQWTLIYEANREIISDPHDIEVGMALVIPPLPVESSEE